MLQGELAIIQLFDGVSVVRKSFGCILLPSITSFFFTDGHDQSAEVEHFSLDPVSDMNKWITQICGESFKFVLQIRLSICADKLDMVLLTESDIRFLLSIFILGQEVCKLTVELEFLLFHRDNSPNILLEVLQVPKENLLFLHEIIDVCGVLGKDAVSLIRSRKLNIVKVIFDNLIGICFGQHFEVFINFALWAQKDLNLRRFS